jgi:RNA polymerase sigma-70 factor (ECF subfamily)
MPPSRTDIFDRQVAPHLDTLLRVAFRLVRNAADAQDLVQDTCIAACEHPEDVDAADHSVRWLLRVLHNRFLDRQRQHRRSPLVAIDEADRQAPLVSEAPGPEESLLRSEGERALEQAYLKLEPGQRTLLVLRAEGHDLAEIESITGIHKEVLRARLHRARRSLARHLDERPAGVSAVPAGRTA